ncbi:MAG: hypothetical protein PHE17_21205 [Thiothrix sp.]|uniref:hypothetical protein n=1 Tax=Thiothrix sp. TaxID=1032 RepID=UPI002609E90E|nr:hypothetical protein [Thiothrix sp.]MDD5395549.1 hypothetical protein [Thiothrix sp.]
MTTAAQINTYLHQLGWQAYIPAFAELLQRFEGTQEEREQEGDNTLPECLCAWLATLTWENAKSRRLALLALRHWKWLYFRAKVGVAEWDYRQCSFTGFCQQSGEQGITTWFVQTQCHFPALARSLGLPRRTAKPTLAQGLGFLRQHCQPAGKLG